MYINDVKARLDRILEISFRIETKLDKALAKLESLAKVFSSRRKSDFNVYWRKS